MEPLFVHAARGRAIRILMISLAGAALCAWLAWAAADPGFAGGAHRASVLEDIPAPVRFMFFGMSALACIYAAALALRAAMRSGPSFMIAPDGITDLRTKPPLHFGWQEIGTVRVDRRFLYANRRGNRGRFGRNRIAIPLRGVAPDADTILHAVSSHMPRRQG